MPNFSRYILFVFIVLLFAYGKHNNERYSLTPVDSFKLRTVGSIYSSVDPKILNDKDSVFYTYLDSRDTTFDLISLSSGSAIRVTPLRKALDATYTFPRGYTYYNDTLILMSLDKNNDNPRVTFLDNNGNIYKSYRITNYDTNDFLGTNISYYNGNLYVSSSTLKPGCKSFVNKYCDYIFRKTDNTFAFDNYSGKFPLDYFIHQNHLTEFYRIILKSGNTIYFHQGSDSIYKYDAAGNLLRSTVMKGYNNEILPYDASKHGNMRYINEYYRLSGQNEQCSYNDGAVVFVVKKLKKASIADNDKRILFGVDTNLNTMFKIPVSNGSYFAKNNFLYLKKFGDSVITKYKLAHE